MSSPIPEPQPIVMDESWLNDGNDELDLKPAIIQAAFQQPNVGDELPPPENGQMPGQTPGQMPGQPRFSQQGDEQRPPSHIQAPLAQLFRIRAFEEIGKINRIFISRDEMLVVLGASEFDGTFKKPMESIQVTGRKLGSVELTLIGERGEKKYRVQITPSVTQIEALIARQFPLSSVEVTAAGDRMLVLSGSVEAPGDVEGILQLVKSFVGGQGEVVNGIKISGVMQVQLEVVIARIDRAELRRLGLNFQYAGKGGFAGSQLGNIGGVTAIDSSVANTAAAAGGNAFQAVGGPAASMVTPASTVFFGATHELQQFMGQIEALQQQGVAKVLAKPILTTLNGRPAEFLVGGEQPYPIQTSAVTSPSVEFKKFGTRLNFVPLILGPDKIRLDLVPEHSSVNFTQALVVGGNQVPQFVTQRIHTTVEMEPGQTLVLGGLLQTESDAQVEKVPVLGSLPVIGAAFRKVRHQERELELIVIVTPRLVQPLSETDCPPLLPGQESRRPTDKELYWHGMPESPLGLPEYGEPDFDPGQYGAATVPRRSTSADQTAIQQVGHSELDPPKKPWLRMPKFTRKRQPTPHTSP